MSVLAGFLAAVSLFPSVAQPPPAADDAVRAIGVTDAAGRVVSITDRSHAVKKGRTYLYGAWVRFTETKLLFRAYAHGLSSGKTLRRIVSFAGESNPDLTPYLSDRTRSLLGGDPSRWRLVCREMTFAEDVAGDRLSVYCGALKGARYDLAGLFVADVTDGATLDVVVTPGRPVKRLEVIDLDNGDVVWRKVFDSPTEAFRETLPSGVSARRAHALRAVYADGSETRETCPLGNLKLMDIDR